MAARRPSNACGAAARPSSIPAGPSIEIGCTVAGRSATRGGIRSDCKQQPVEARHVECRRFELATLSQECLVEKGEREIGKGFGRLWRTRERIEPLHQGMTDVELEQRLAGGQLLARCLQQAPQAVAELAFREHETCR